MSEKLLIRVNISDPSIMQKYIYIFKNIVNNNYRNLSVENKIKILMPDNIDNMLSSDLLLIDYNFEKMTMMITSHSQRFFTSLKYKNDGYTIKSVTIENDKFDLGVIMKNIIKGKE